jgi:hypothetical protein
MSYVLPNFSESTDASAGSLTTHNLGIGETAQGSISALGNHDWYRLNLVAGQTYTFALTGTGTNNLQDPCLGLDPSPADTEFDSALDQFSYGGGVLSVTLIAADLRASSVILAGHRASQAADSAPSLDGHAANTGDHDLWRDESSRLSS